MSPMRTAPSALTANDEQLRSQYLDEVLGLLYPGTGESTMEYLVVP
jgi:hypothetical protein